MTKLSNCATRNHEETCPWFLLQMWCAERNKGEKFCFEVHFAFGKYRKCNVYHLYYHYFMINMTDKSCLYKYACVTADGYNQCWSESGLGLGLNGWVRVRVRTRVRTRTLPLWTRTRTRTPPLWTRTQALWTRTLVLWTRTRTRIPPRWTRTHSESRWVRWEMYKANLNFLMCNNGRNKGKELIKLLINASISYPHPNSNSKI